MDKLSKELNYLAHHFKVPKPKWRIVGKGPKVMYSKTTIKKPKPGITIKKKITDRVNGHLHTTPLEIIFNGPPSRSTAYHEFIHYVENLWCPNHRKYVKAKNCPICRGIIFHSDAEIEAYRERYLSKNSVEVKSR